MYLSHCYHNIYSQISYQSHNADKHQIECYTLDIVTRFKIYRYHLEDMILCSIYVDLHGLEPNLDTKSKTLRRIPGIKWVKWIYMCLYNDYTVFWLYNVQFLGNLSCIL